MKKLAFLVILTNLIASGSCMRDDNLIAAFALFNAALAWLLIALLWRENR